MVLHKVQNRDEANTPESDFAATDRPAKPIKPPVFTQVVEVVDEEKEETPPLKENFSPARPPESAEGMVPEQAAMKLPVDNRAIEKEDFMSSPPREEAEKSAPVNYPTSTLVEQPDVSEKEVVDELFTPESTVGYPEISEHKRGPGRNLAVWAILVIAVAAAVGAAIVFFSQGSVTVSSVPISSVGPTPAPLPPEDTSTPGASTPTPTVSAAGLSRADLTVQVQNGGGVKGAGSKMKAFLEKKGYTVGDVGNAAEYTYDTTEIYVKPNKEKYLQLLADDLKGDYTIGKQEATLEDDVAYDARVIVGKE